MSASTQNGRRAAMPGMALEVKKGIMRCATAMNTNRMKPHSAVCTQCRAVGTLPMSTLTIMPSRLTQPMMPAMPTVRACT